MKLPALLLSPRSRFLAGLLLAVSVLGACGGGKRPASALSEADRLALDDYEHIRAALAVDDAVSAKKAAAKMVADLTSTDPKAPAPPLLESATGVADAQALDTMRQRFEILSDHVVPMVSGMEGYYVMRSDLPNTAPWVQKSPDVDNPYFGKAMHGLGELKK